MTIYKCGVSEKNGGVVFYRWLILEKKEKVFYFLWNIHKRTFTLEKGKRKRSFTFFFKHSQRAFTLEKDQSQFTLTIRMPLYSVRLHPVPLMKLEVTIHSHHHSAKKNIIIQRIDQSGLLLPQSYSMNAELLRRHVLYIVQCWSKAAMLFNSIGKIKKSTI